jgi:hypothetical protein
MLTLVSKTATIRPAHGFGGGAFVGRADVVGGRVGSVPIVGASTGGSLSEKVCFYEKKLGNLLQP